MAAPSAIPLELPRRSRSALEKIYNTACSQAARGDPRQVRQAEAATQALFDQMAAAGHDMRHLHHTALPAHKDSWFGYAAVYHTLEAVRNRRPLPALASAILAHRQRTRRLSAVGKDAHGYHRCASCGRFTSPVRSHLCPITASPETLNRALMRRLGVPATAYGHALGRSARQCQEQRGNPRHAPWPDRRDGGGHPGWAAPGAGNGLHPGSLERPDHRGRVGRRPRRLGAGCQRAYPASSACRCDRRSRSSLWDIHTRRCAGRLSSQLTVCFLITMYTMDLTLIYRATGHTKPITLLRQLNLCWCKSTPRWTPNRSPKRCAPLPSLSRQRLSLWIRMKWRNCARRCRRWLKAVETLAKAQGKAPVVSTDPSAG